MPRLLAAAAAQEWIVGGYAVIGNNRPGSRAAAKDVPHTWNDADEVLALSGSG